MLEQKTSRRRRETQHSSNIELDLHDDPFAISANGGAFSVVWGLGLILTAWLGKTFSSTTLGGATVKVGVRMSVYCTRKDTKIGFGQKWQCFIIPSKNRKKWVTTSGVVSFSDWSVLAEIYLHDESFAFRTNVLSGRQLGVAGCRFVLGGCHVSKSCHALIRGGNDTRVRFYVGLIM